MPRAIIDKSILDSLIRAKLATLEGCRDVEALPVTWRENGERCNWMLPGWTGDAQAVAKCSDRMSHYLSFLQAQFDIPPEPAGGGKAPKG